MKYTKIEEHINRELYNECFNEEAIKRQIEELREYATRHAYDNNQTNPATPMMLNAATSIEVQDRLIHTMQKELEDVVDLYDKNVLWRFPCEVGTKVYIVIKLSDKRILPFVIEGKIVSYRITKNKKTMEIKTENRVREYSVGKFGEEVFLSASDANKFINSEHGSSYEPIK